MKELNKEELEMTSRQIMAVGIEKQNILKKSHLLVIGAGGIGSGLLPYLVSSGVGEITLYEDDLIEKSNLGRQILFSHDQVGTAKGAVALNFLYAINPHIKINWINKKFSLSKSLSSRISFDMILEGSDDAKLKFELSEFCLQEEIRLMIGALSFRQAHIFYQNGKRNDACYRCIFQNLPSFSKMPSCATEGILSPMPGVIGSMMAYLAVNLLLENSENSMYYILENLSWRNKNLLQQKNCPCHNLHTRGLA